jgi:3-oxoadipate enol-lactonase
VAEIEIAPGRTTHYDIAGRDGAPVVQLISGGGASRRSWEPTVAALSGELRVVTFDYRDSGESDPETEAYSMADIADDAVSLLEALGIRRSHVVGFSVGGSVAQHVALRHPEVVDRLVLVGAAPAVGSFGIPIAMPTAADWMEDPVKRMRRALRRGAARGFYDERPAQLEADSERDRGNRQTLDGSARQLAAFEAHDVRKELHAIQAPTLVVDGELDFGPLVRGAEMIAERVPDARLVMYPGVGHSPMAEVAEQFHADLLAFLRA